MKEHKSKKSEHVSRFLAISQFRQGSAFDDEASSDHPSAAATLSFAPWHVMAGLYLNKQYISVPHTEYGCTEYITRLEGS